MNPHDPGPPLLFTMIMKQMVMPRTTSNDTSRFIGDAAMAGFVVVLSGEVARPG
jgi:hypothetical protein